MPRRLTLHEFSLVEEAPPDVERVSLCHGCAHLEGANRDGTARCRAFARIPAAIWSGQADHRATIQGDGGTVFTPLGRYGQDVEVAFTAAIEAAPVEEEVVPDEEMPPDPEAEEDEGLRPVRPEGQTAEAMPGAPPEEFHTVMVVEGVPSGDRRLIESGALWWPPLPLPFRWQDREPEMGGHAESVHVGNITRVERQGDTLHGWGHLFKNDPDGARFDNLLTEAGLLPVSIDMDDVDVSIVWPEEDEDSMLLAEPEQVRFTRGRIVGATSVPIPAFQEAFVERVSVEEREDEEEVVEEAAIIAAAAPVHPPAAWFDDPLLDGPTPLTVLDDGRVFGHLATWGTCHTGFQGACITPPREESYDYFTLKEAHTAEGTKVPVGTITLGTGHARLDADPTAAVAHYDHTGTAAADVAAGSDEHGIWLAGAVRPHLTARQVRDLRGSAPSGDWRRIKGALRLVATLGVNVPGYPVPRTAAHVASGEQTSLVAAGHLAPHPDTADPPARRYGNLADRIAASVGRDRRGRATAAAARVHVHEFGCGCGKAKAANREAREAARARVASASGAGPYQVVMADGEVVDRPTLLDARRLQRSSPGSRMRTP